MSLGVNPTLFVIFVFAAITIYALIRTVAPFLEDPKNQLRLEMLDEELEEIERLVARKSVLLQSLQDIEFDHDTGKLSDDDYERLKHKYERQAVHVMRQLDEVRGGVDMDDEIDRALEARLGDTTLEAPADEPPPSEPASESEEPAADDAPRSCPDCGKSLEPEARFCSQCGTPLDPPGESADDADEESAGDFDESEPTGEDSSHETAEPGVSDFRSEATGS